MSPVKVKEIHAVKIKSKLPRPLFVTHISAGFPSPADDYIDKKLDLNEFLIKNPSATFFVKVEGDSMIDSGIHSGDMLVVDRSLHAVNNKIIIAKLNGDLTVKRMRKTGRNIYLVPDNVKFKPTKIDDHADFEVWGVVTAVIRQV